MELTKEFKEQIEKEAAELYPIFDNTAYNYTINMERYAYKTGRSNSITEIQGLQTEIKETIEVKKRYQLSNGKLQKEVWDLQKVAKERDQKIVAMREYIKALEANCYGSDSETTKILNDLRDKAGL